MALALLFSTFVLLHELAHAVVAKAQGLDVRRITLFLLGGVTQILSEAGRPADEYRFAIAGPLASLTIASVLAATSRLLHAGVDGLPGLWGTLAQINMALALFNLVPAFPLDGGRVLRAGLWAGLRDRAKATRWASAGGKAFAFALMGAGASIVVVGAIDRNTGGFSGFWYLVLGYFLFNVAGTAGRVEGGAVPRTAPRVPAPPENVPVRPRWPGDIVVSHEGQAAEPDARGGGVRLDERPDAPPAPGDQPRDRPRDPRRRPPHA
jgi:Zn-dependent protease